MKFSENFWNYSTERWLSFDGNQLRRTITIDKQSL